MSRGLPLCDGSSSLAHSWGKSEAAITLPMVFKLWMICCPQARLWGTDGRRVFGGLTYVGVLRDILRSTTAIVPLQCAGPLVATAQAAALRDPVVNQVFELADLDAKTAGTLAAVLRPVLSISILLFIVRIVLTW